MTQPSLAFEDAPVTRRQKKAGHVRSSSVRTHQAETARLQGRMAAVRAFLEGFTGWYGEAPTSAELAQYAPNPSGIDNDDALLLYVRRGLSDLQDKNVVEAVPQGKRPCRISGHLCHTWRLTQR